MICNIYMLMKAYIESCCPVGGGGVILEGTTPIRIEMFQYGIKIIS